MQCQFIKTERKNQATRTFSIRFELLKSMKLISQMLMF